MPVKSEYNLFVKKMMKNPEVLALPNHERFSKISQLWRTRFAVEDQLAMCHEDVKLLRKQLQEKKTVDLDRIMQLGAEAEAKVLKIKQKLEARKKIAAKPRSKSVEISVKGKSSSPKSVRVSVAKPRSKSVEIKVKGNSSSPKSVRVSVAKPRSKSVEIKVKGKSSSPKSVRVSVAKPRSKSVEISVKGKSSSPKSPKRVSPVKVVSPKRLSPQAENNRRNMMLEKARADARVKIEQIKKEAREQVLSKDSRAITVDVENPRIKEALLKAQKRAAEIRETARAKVAAKAM